MNPSFQKINRDTALPCLLYLERNFLLQIAGMEFPEVLNPIFTPPPQGRRVQDLTPAQCFKRRESPDDIPIATRNNDRILQSQLTEAAFAGFKFFFIIEDNPRNGLGCARIKMNEAFIFDRRGVVQEFKKPIQCPCFKET